eukprot:gene15205-21280_t
MEPQHRLTDDSANRPGLPSAQPRLVLPQYTDEHIFCLVDKFLASRDLTNTRAILAAELKTKKLKGTDAGNVSEEERTTEPPRVGALLPPPPGIASDGYRPRGDRERYDERERRRDPGFDSRRGSPLPSRDERGRQGGDRGGGRFRGNPEAQRETSPQDDSRHPRDRAAPSRLTDRDRNLERGASDRVRDTDVVPKGALPGPDSSAAARGDNDPSRLGPPVPGDNPVRSRSRQPGFDRDERREERDGNRLPLPPPPPRPPHALPGPARRADSQRVPIIVPMGAHGSLSTNKRNERVTEPERLGGGDRADARRWQDSPPRSRPERDSRVPSLSRSRSPVDAHSRSPRGRKSLKGHRSRSPKGRSSSPKGRGSRSPKGRGSKSPKGYGRSPKGRGSRSPGGGSPPRSARAHLPSSSPPRPRSPPSRQRSLSPAKPAKHSSVSPARPHSPPSNSGAAESPRKGGNRRRRGSPKAKRSRKGKTSRSPEAGPSRGPSPCAGAGDRGVDLPDQAEKLEGGVNRPNERRAASPALSGGDRPLPDSRRPKARGRTETQESMGPREAMGEDRIPTKRADAPDEGAAMDVGGEEPKQRASSEPRGPARATSPSAPDVAVGVEPMHELLDYGVDDVLEELGEAAEDDRYMAGNKDVGMEGGCDGEDDGPVQGGGEDGDPVQGGGEGANPAEEERGGNRFRARSASRDSRHRARSTSRSPPRIGRESPHKSEEDPGQEKRGIGSRAPYGAARISRGNGRDGGVGGGQRPSVLERMDRGRNVDHGRNGDTQRDRPPRVDLPSIPRSFHDGPRPSVHDRLDRGNGRPGPRGRDHNRQSGPGGGGGGGSDWGHGRGPARGGNFQEGNANRDQGGQRPKRRRDD